MLRFKVLLWLLAKLLQRATRNDPACARYVQGKDLVFQIRTQAGSDRHFTVRDGKIRSAAGQAKAPQFTMTFSDAAKGFAILSAKDSKEAFLNGLHSGDLSLSGDFVAVMWFQGLSAYLQPAQGS